MRYWNALLSPLLLMLMMGCAQADAPQASPAVPNFSTTAALGNDVPLPDEEAFKVEAVAMSEGELLVRFTMPDGYYLYRDKARFLVENEDAANLTPVWPQAVAHHDEHFGAVAVYYGQIEVPLSISERVDPAAPMTLIVRLQGCKENSVCYPPMQRKISL
jgi:thiol:disulfide interchange protein DsbD